MNRNQFERNFRINLISLRKASGLSQKELAAELGVKREKVRNWENDSCFPHLQEALFIAAFFQVSLNDMGGDVIVSKVTGHAA